MSANWKKALLGPNDSIERAVRNLEETALQVVLVVSEDQTLLGTVTDGDIRRGLLKGLDLNKAIHNVMNPNSFVVMPTMSRETVLELMKANRIHQIPIVDDQRKVLGLHVLDEILQPNRIDNMFVIMAGGKGVRLRPHTENCPKPLLPVAGKPMLEHIIQRAKAEGFHKFVVSVNYLGHMIEEYFENGKKWDVEIAYLREDKPLGTAGALSLMERNMDKPFVVCNGDVITDIRYSEMLDFHSFHQAKATMAIRAHEWEHPFGVVHIKGSEIVRFEEKPVFKTHVNAGIYVINPECLSCLTEGESLDMPNFFSKIKEKSGKTIAYPMHEPWLDVGRPDDYVKAELIYDQIE